MNNKIKTILCKKNQKLKKIINAVRKKAKETLINIFCKKTILLFLKFIIVPIVLFFLFLVMPIIFEIIISFLIGKQIITTNLESTYIEFYATILSGLFTLVGVARTIKYERKQKVEEETITYKPILIVDGINKHHNCMKREVGLGMGYCSSKSDSDSERNSELFYEQQKINNPKYCLYIKNKGRGETFNAVLDEFELVEANWDDKINVYPNIGGNQYIGEVLKDEYIGIDVNLPNYLFMPEEMKGILLYELITKTIISYSDMFNRVRYQYCIHTTYKVIVEEFIECQPYFYKEGFKYAKVRYEIYQIMPEMKIYSKKQKKFIHEHEYVLEKLKN